MSIHWYIKYSEDVFKNSSCSNAQGKLKFVKPLLDINVFFKISFVHKWQIEYSYNI